MTKGRNHAKVFTIDVSRLLSNPTRSGGQQNGCLDTYISTYMFFEILVFFMTKQTIVDVLVSVKESCLK